MLSFHPGIAEAPRMSGNEHERYEEVCQEPSELDNWSTGQQENIRRFDPTVDFQALLGPKLDKSCA